MINFIFWFWILSAIIAAIGFISSALYYLISDKIQEDPNEGIKTHWICLVCLIPIINTIHAASFVFQFYYILMDRHR